MRFWRRRAGARTGVALAAAYLFALHALLSSVALSHMAGSAAAQAAGGDFASVICHNGGGQAADQDGTDGAAPRQSPCSLCAATLTPTILAAAILYVTPQLSAFEPALPAQAAASVPRLITPRLSQGPPSIA